MRSPALMSICSKTGCHAVLAPLSGCYPPLEGRSPTCYSPVRHSVTPCGATAFDLHVLGTPPALILSQDQTLMLKRFIRLRRLRGYGEIILITRAPVDIWLCVVLLLSEYPRARESKPPAPCWLILDGCPTSPCSSRRSATSRRLCLHVLFSFQRTDCPDARSTSPGRLPIRDRWPFLGEPSYTTTAI